MGYLHYGPQQVFPFEDRVLAHLRAVIIGKLILQESFVFTWNDAGIQQTIWLHPTMTLYFEFEGVTPHEINRSWVETLTALANGPSGLKLVPEPHLES